MCVSNQYLAGQYLLSKADDSTVPMVPGVPAPAKTKDGLGAESGKSYYPWLQNLSPGRLLISGLHGFPDFCTDLPVWSPVTVSQPASSLTLHPLHAILHSEAA